MKNPIFTGSKGRIICRNSLLELVEQDFNLLGLEIVFKLVILYRAVTSSALVNGLYTETSYFSNLVFVKFRCHADCFRKRIVRQFSPDPSDTEVEELRDETFSIPLPPSPLVTQTKKPLKSCTINFKTASESEQRHLSKTRSRGSCSGPTSSAPKASLFSNTHSLPPEHLRLPPPPAPLPVTTVEAAAQLLVAVPGNKELHTDHVNSTLLTDRFSVMSDVSPRTHETVEVPLPVTPVISQT